MPDWKRRGLDRAERVGLTAQLEVLKRTVGPAADGWEIDYEPGWGWGVLDRTAQHRRVTNIPAEPLGMKRWPVEDLRDALAIATEAARLTRRTFER